MDKNKNCSACNINKDKDNYKKARTIWKNCYNKKKTTNFVSKRAGKKVSTSDKQINDNEASVSTFENHRYVIIGPSNVGKTFYMLKILERIDNKRPIHIITRSLIQHPN